MSVTTIFLFNETRKLNPLLLVFICNLLRMSISLFTYLNLHLKF